jgi:pyoverdine/dityrosine biosynthesis protein Dit1
MDERISEVKNTVGELISNIIPRIDAICRTYNDTDTFEADRLQHLFDDLQALAEGMDFLKEYSESIDLFEFQEKLDLMERALDANDRMLFIDIMQYELKGLLEFWREILI